jgi:hypothetical protein
MQQAAGNKSRECKTRKARRHRHFSLDQTKNPHQFVHLEELLLAAPACLL